MPRTPTPKLYRWRHNAWRDRKHWAGPFRLPELAVQQLDDEDNDYGAVEAAASTARNNSEAIGRLLVVLERKGLVGVEEIEEVLGIFGDLREADDASAE